MIDAYTFKGCLSLKDVTIPDTVKVIQSAAFRSTGLQKLYIPKSVTVIGNATFTDCQLTEVIFEDPSTLQVSRSFFADSSYMLSFSVLCSCVCSRLISPSVSSWHKQDNTLMHQSPGHIQRRTPYNF